jgi:hypothetical protein
MHRRRLSSLHSEHGVGIARTDGDRYRTTTKRCQLTTSMNTYFCRSVSTRPVIELRRPQGR